jgi:alginate O-acetyltransferase complex protein AlgI
MLFHSLEFIIFFTIICLAYFSIPHRFRWLLLLTASYFFYMCWKAEYAVLMFISTSIVYFSTIQISKANSQSKRKFYLFLSLVSNLLILFFFKYFNFVNDTLEQLLGQFKLEYDKPVLNVLLPVGISFYIFQAIGYSIDVYRKNAEPEYHFGRFALFISFFPQLVAGPIERSKNILPRLKQKIEFSYANLSAGLKKMLWGYFLKIVVADRLSIYVDAIFNNIEYHSSLTIITASSFFLFQIYCDFAGYTFIAIGAAKILGIDLMENFRRPNFAASIGELWKRWHISLSTWFKDYVYIPLGGNRVSRPRFYMNLYLTFLISGIWHGANLTFVLWGALHGFYMVVEVFLKKNIKFAFLQKYDFRILGILVVFGLKVISYFFFRANTISDSFLIFEKVFFNWVPGFYAGDAGNFVNSLLAIALLILIEAKQEFYPGRFSFFHNRHYLVRAATVAVMIALILTLGVFDGGQFIYFQF